MEEKKIHECPECGKSFPKRDKLNRHIKTHTGEKPYKCEHCDSAFSQKDKLNRHVLIHTRQRLYKCELCEKSFMRKDHLDIHNMTHTGEKPFKCEHCSKSFMNQLCLDSHVLTHTGANLFKCQQCDKSYCSKRSLERHALVHSGDKPYVCDFCNMAFVRKDLLKLHTRKRHRLDLLLDHVTSERPVENLLFCDVSIKKEPEDQDTDTIEEESFVESEQMSVQITDGEGNVMAPDDHFETFENGRMDDNDCPENILYPEITMKEDLEEGTEIEHADAEACESAVKQEIQDCENTESLQTVEKVHHCKGSDKLFYPKDFFDRQVLTQCGKKSYKCDMHVLTHNGANPFKSEHCDKSNPSKQSLERHEYDEHTTQGNKDKSLLTEDCPVDSVLSSEITIKEEEIHYNEGEREHIEYEFQDMAVKQEIPDIIFNDI